MRSQGLSFARAYWRISLSRILRACVSCGGNATAWTAVRSTSHHPSASSPSAPIDIRKNSRLGVGFAWRNTSKIGRSARCSAEERQVRISEASMIGRCVWQADAHWFTASASCRAFAARRGCSPSQFDLESRARRGAALACAWYRRHV